MDFELNWEGIVHDLPKAAIIGIVVGILALVMIANFTPSVGKLSYDFWTKEAEPFRIVQQYQGAGDKVWAVELDNVYDVPVELYGMSVVGSGQETNWMLANASRFGAHEGKLVLVPINKSCAANDTYAYSFNITYSVVGGKKIVEEGTYQIFGRCG